MAVVPGLRILGMHWKLSPLAIYPWMVMHPEKENGGSIQERQTLRTCVEIIIFGTGTMIKGFGQDIIQGLVH